MSTCLVSAADYKAHWQPSEKPTSRPATPPIEAAPDRCGAKVFEPISLCCDREPGHSGDHRGYLEICDRVMFWADQRTGPADRRKPGHERRWDTAAGRRHGARDRRSPARQSKGAR